MSAPDPRIVYGMTCTWWDSISEVGLINGTLPCCPHCRSVLMEVPNEATWQISIDLYDTKKPGYEAKMKWARGKCFATKEALDQAYAYAQSIKPAPAPADPPRMEMHIMGYRNPAIAAEHIVRAMIEDDPTSLSIDAESFAEAAKIVGEPSSEILAKGWICEDPMRDLQKLAQIGGFQLIFSRGQISINALDDWPR